MFRTAYYPVTGLLAILAGIIILKCLSGCEFVNGINREGNSAKPTPIEHGK